MTTTNRAFIKAYRHDAPQIAPTGPSTRTQPRHHGAPVAVDLLASSVEYVSFGGEGAASAGATYSTTFVDNSERPGTPRLTTLHRGGGSTIPRTIGGERHLPGAPKIARSSFAAPRHDTSTPVKRPLSTFTPAPARQSPEPRSVHVRPAPSSPSTGAAFQPATTIASFRWPAVCRTLWRESTREFDRVERLLGEVTGNSKALVALVGLFPGQGCTTTLLALAGGLAARGGRILVVDANFRAPRLAHWLDVESDTTWQDVLERGVPVADAVVRSIDDNLDLLPYVPHPASRETSKSTIGLHASVTAGILRHAYDLVLLDLGSFFTPDSQAPLLELTRTMRIDHAIAVAGPETPDPRDLDTLGEHLGACDCRLLGTIENRVA